MKTLTEFIQKLEEIKALYPDIQVNAEKIVLHFSTAKDEEPYIIIH